MNLIIDSHCHYGKGDGLTGPWDTRANLDKYLRRAREYGINKTVLFSVFHSDYSRANFEVAKMVASNPQRFYGYAFIHPYRDAGRVFKMIETAVKKYNFCGIKVHRYDGRMTREICDTAKFFNLPVLYDVMGEVSAVELLAEEYPDVSFIIPHLGNFSDEWKSQLMLLPMLEKCENIYTDTSGIRRFDLLERGVQKAGPGKFLFGSDGPWLHPGVEISKIYALNLNEEDSNKILAGNFLKLISGIREYLSEAGMDREYKPLALTQHKIKDPWLT